MNASKGVDCVLQYELVRGPTATASECETLLFALPELFDLSRYHLDLSPQQLPPTAEYVMEMSPQPAEEEEEFESSVLSKEERVEDGSGYDEIVDLFVDPTDPSKMLLTRSGRQPLTPLSSSIRASSLLPPQPPPVIISPNKPLAPGSDPKSPIACPSKRPAEGPCEEKLAIKRERNRQAAGRCRQRRLDLISSLQQEVDKLRAERDRLLGENRMLLEMLAKTGQVCE